jgi:hypothetical protein
VAASLATNALNSSQSPFAGGENSLTALATGGNHIDSAHSMVTKPKKVILLI